MPAAVVTAVTSTQVVEAFKEVTEETEAFSLCVEASVALIGGELVIFAPSRSIGNGLA